MSMENETITPEMRARADARVAKLRADAAARDAETDKANREFAEGFRKGLTMPMGPNWYEDWLRENSR